MAPTIELLRAKPPAPAGEAFLIGFVRALRAMGEPFVETSAYEGRAEWLVLFGVGAEPHDRARNEHVAKGGKALLWDLGYFGRRRIGGYSRASINHEHPQDLLDFVEPNPTRWDEIDVPLRDDHDPNGHIVLVGMGHKARAYLGMGWEERKFRQLAKRFPVDRIVYRPKRPQDGLRLPCKRDSAERPIEDLLRGAALVVCRHSNVAVDATVAGVPFETDDGAAAWLARRAYTPENRLDFLRRLAWFQWRADEAAFGWRFFKDLGAQMKTMEAPNAA